METERIFLIIFMQTVSRHGTLKLQLIVLSRNYGESVFSHYNENNFLCLPEILRRKGYSTSWINGADAAYDNQLTMFPKIGFQNIIDRFDFPSDTETLGWGYS